MDGGKRPKNRTTQDQRGRRAMEKDQFGYDKVKPKYEDRNFSKLGGSKEYPIYHEGDLICNVCGEPWDTYGVLHGDMTKEEEIRFRKGYGCPCCSPQGEDQNGPEENVGQYPW